MRRIAIICFWASISVLVNAQKIAIIPEVTSLDDRTVVEFDNKICATEESTVSYRVTLEGFDLIDSVQVCQYTFNEVEYEAIFTLNDGVVTIDDIAAPLAVGLNSFVFKLSVQENGKEGVTELTQAATSIQIYPVPTHQEVYAPSSLVFYNETAELSWRAYGEGGAKWEYSWTSTEGLTGSGDTFVHPSIINNGMSEKKALVSLSATNYAPDGITVWDSYKYEWTITIFPLTNVTTSISPNSIETPYIQFQGNSLDLSVSPIGGNPDGWKIEWRDGDSNILLGQESAFKITGSSANKIETRHIVLHVTNIAPEGFNSENTIWNDEVFHYYLRFYPIPQIEITSISPNSIETPYKQFQGNSLDLSVFPTGGNPDGWKIEWRDGDSNILLGQESVYKITGTSTNKIENRHIVLHVTNIAPEGFNSENTIWKDEVFHYYLRFYPIPQIEFEKEYPQDVLDGEKIPMSIKCIDGDLADEYVINCEWNGNNNGDSYLFEAVNSSNEEGIQKNISVKCSFGLVNTDSKSNFSKELTHTFMVWPIPYATTTDIVKRVGCAGQPFNYSVSVTGGKKNGWTYAWSLNNQSIDYNTNTLNLTLENSSVTDSVVNNYKVRVTNRSDKEVWFDAEYLFTVIVYPEPKTPERIVVMDQNRGVEVHSCIREGNEMILYCDECTGGNPDGWSYKWFKNNNLLGSNNKINEKIASNYTGNGKDNNLVIDYECYVENLYGDISWKKQEYKKEIKVYRKPQTPTGLQKKGDGTSGTWIASCELDDTNLSVNDYYLVFGYRDANGIMHDLSTMKQQDVGGQRWSSLQQSFDGNAYVYSLWKYDDGSEVTSGLCMENSIDEDWDGSTYDGATRSVIAESTSVGDKPSDQIMDNADYYSLDGSKILQPKRGINIVRYKNGKVLKIINK